MKHRSGFPDSDAESAARPRSGLLAAVLSLLVAVCSAQPAAPALDDWRSQVAEVRVLAENDVPRAQERAQQLESTLPASATPADRARLLNLLARIELYRANTVRSNELASQAFELASRNGDKIGQAEADLNTALNSVNEARIDKLIASTTRAVTEVEGIDRPDLQVEALLRASVMYRRVGQVDDSVTLAMQALEVARRSNNALALTYAHQGLGIAFDQSFRDEESRQHFESMREQARAAQSRQLEAYAVVGLGNMASKRGDTELGEKLIREAVGMFRESGAPFAIAFGVSQIAARLADQRRFAEAKHTIGESIAIYEQHQNRIGLWFTLNSRSAYDEGLGDMPGARADADRAYDIAKDIGFALYVSDSARRRAELAAAAGDFRTAYALSVEASQKSADAARDRVSVRMVQLAQRYEAASRQREINELTARNHEQTTALQQALLRQRLLWTVVLSGVLILVGGSYFLLRLRSSQSKLLRQTTILRSVLDSMTDGVVVADAAGRPIVTNPSARRLLGDTVAGDDVRDWPQRHGLFRPDRVTEYPCRDLPLVKALDGQPCDDVEIYANPPGGDGRWLLAASRPLPNAAGSPGGGVTVFADITDRRRAEEALRRREQEFRALVEHSPDLVARYDVECRRIYVNPALAAALGTPAEALLGVEPRDVPHTPAGQAQDYLQRVRKVFETGENTSVEATIGESELQFRLVAEFGPLGEVSSVLAIGRDVSALMRTQRQLSTLLDNLPDMIARFDLNRRFVYASPVLSKTLEIPAEAFIGRTSRELGLDQTGMLAEALQRVIRERRPCQLEVPLGRTASGEERTFEVRYIPELDQNGTVTSMIAITREVTERKRVERLVRDLAFRREAAREDERKSIARELHDELGQLLSALRLEVSVLRMRHGTVQPEIAERAVSMLALVDSVIRLQRDLVSSLRPAVLDMGVAAALEWLVGQFSTRTGIECRLSLNESDVQLDADQTAMVFRIVQESLTNAARHAHATRVDVALQRVGETCTLSIRDNGRGFDARAPRDPRSLGLAGMQERAQMLGGRLDVQSSPGAGVAITVTFPATLHLEREPAAERV